MHHTIEADSESPWIHSGIRYIDTQTVHYVNQIITEYNLDLALHTCFTKN